MAIKIIMLISGLLVCGAGLTCRIKEKNDPEGRNIYTIIGLIGLAVAVVFALLLFL